MRLRTILSYPWFMDRGGGARLGQVITRGLAARGHEVLPLDYSSLTDDFEAILVFGCQHVNAEVLHYLRERGKRVVVLPIFDRPRSLPMMKAFRILHRAPFNNDYRHRARVFAAAHRVVCANDSEAQDVMALYKVQAEQVAVVHHGVDESFLALLDGADGDGFGKAHPGWKDFVFFPSAQVSQRKGQLELLRALAGTGIPVVMNNVQTVPDGMAAAFRDAMGRNRSLGLGPMSPGELADCYRAAVVSVSLSRSETAGFANLEALYSGCSLVVNDIPAYREYLGPHARYVRRGNPRQVREAVQAALASPGDGAAGRAWVRERYRWSVALAKIEGELHG